MLGEFGQMSQGRKQAEVISAPTAIVNHGGNLTASSSNPAAASSWQQRDVELEAPVRLIPRSPAVTQQQIKPSPPKALYFSAPTRAPASPSASAPPLSFFLFPSFFNLLENTKLLQIHSGFQFSTMDAPGGETGGQNRKILFSPLDLLTSHPRLAPLGRGKISLWRYILRTTHIFDFRFCDGSSPCVRT